MAETKPSLEVLGGTGTTARTQEGAAEPSTVPPSATVAQGVTAGGVTAWVNNQRINALWCINENRNAWIGVAGVGWKKLANNDDTAVVALTSLGASAKQTQTAVNYREEADGMIHELYVW